MTPGNFLRYGFYWDVAEALTPYSPERPKHPHKLQVAGYGVRDGQQVSVLMGKDDEGDYLKVHRATTSVEAHHDIRADVFRLPPEQGAEASDDPLVYEQYNSEHDRWEYHIKTPANAKVGAIEATIPVSESTAFSLGTLTLLHFD